MYLLENLTKAQVDAVDSIKESALHKLCRHGSDLDKLEAKNVIEAFVEKLN
jgi:hypothetical protein